MDLPLLAIGNNSKFWIQQGNRAQLFGNIGYDNPKQKNKSIKGKVHFKTFFADSDAEYVVLT